MLSAFPVKKVFLMYICVYTNSDKEDVWYLKQTNLTVTPNHFFHACHNNSCITSKLTGATCGAGFSYPSGDDPPVSCGVHVA